MAEIEPMHSTIAELGKVVTQVITMMGGYKKTFRGVKTDSFLVGEYSHFETTDGRKVMIRTENILIIETTKE